MLSAHEIKFAVAVGGVGDHVSCTAVSSEAWAKLRVWASVAGTGRLLLSGSVAHASLETAVC